MCRPQPLGATTDHYWRVQRMAKATGVDLVSAFDVGLLSQVDWARLVTRCRGCAWAEGCGNWLDDTPGDGTRALPARCINHKRLAALQDVAHDATP